MKKLLSLIISLIIVFLSVADGVTVFASTPNDNGLISFADKLISMVREHEVASSYEVESIASPNYGFSDNYENLPKYAFASKRLIVKSKKKINYKGAVDCVSGYRDLYILQYDSVWATKAAYDYFLTQSDIAYVEPDYIVEAQLDDIKDTVSGAVDNVKDYIDEKKLSKDTVDKVYEIKDKVVSWASTKIGFEDIKYKLATRIKNDYIQVAVLDSGVDTDHEIFEDRLIHSTVNFSDSGAKNSCEDDFGHGTHVAGIIVDNTLSNVKIKPYKVLNNKGKGSESLIAVAVDLAVAEGADIINMSLTSNGEFQTMTDSVNNAVANGVNVVVAAGNDKKDLSKSYVSPACIESAFTVSATTKYNKLSDYSNYNGTVDIAAPGDNVKSSYLNNTYYEMSGTSMAAPQVTAGLAIVYSAFPEKTAKEAEDMLCEYAIKLQENEGENKFGAGLLYLKYVLDGMEKSPDPVFSVDSCTFSNSFTLKITCSDPNAKILYLLNSGKSDKLVDFSNGVIYKEPLKISLDTKICAVAYVEGKKFSSVVKKEYVRANNSEADLYDISSTGQIQGYFGVETDLIIPQKIRGVTVKGVATGAFKDNDKIQSVVLPDTVTKIYSEAFMNCTALKSVTGVGVTEIDRNAFSNSSIEEVLFGKLTTIGISAFENCKNIKKIPLSNVVSIQTNAFKNTVGITSLNSEKLTDLGASAFCESELEEINLPNVSSISANAFKGCQKLETVSVPYAKTIGGSAFQDCIMLKTISITDAETLGASALRNTGLESVYFKNVKTVGNFALADNLNLSFVLLPSTETIGTYTFSNCPKLQIVGLPLLKTLPNSCFADCQALHSLWLPSVRTVNRGALESSSIYYLQFDNVEKLLSLPGTLKGVALPTSLTQISATVPANDFVVYGYRNTYAEDFANANNKQFATVPAIVYEIEDRVNIEDKYIIIHTVGFNCKYQWYKNEEFSNEGGTPIEGATKYFYEPNRDDARCYYCVITSDDGINSNTITTNYIVNAPEYRSADFTEYNELYEEYQNLDRTLYKEGALDEADRLFSIKVSDLTLAQQDLLDSIVSDIRNAINSAELNYSLYDVNNDGKITILDARLALKAVVGSITLTPLQILATDVNNDSKISISDSRAILKSVLNT